jgi:steroid delta-isomerase-like uncharacterized protein
MTTDQLTRNKHLVESFIQELFTRGDVTAVDRYLADDFVNHDPPFPGASDGAEGLRHAAEVIRAAVPDWRSEADHYVAEDDLVVEHFHAYGTRTGELFGAPPDGKVLILRGIHIFRIASDRIVERWGPAAAWSTEGDPSRGFGGPAFDEQLAKSGTTHEVT